MEPKDVLLAIAGVALALVVGVLITTQDESLANGQNYFCPDKGYLDIIQLDPLQARFICPSEGGEFEVVFSGPNDDSLIKALRDKNQASGMGVVLDDDQVIQVYQVISGLIKTHWGED